MPNVNVEFNHGKIDELFDRLDVVAVVGWSADYAAYVNFPTEYTGTAPPFQPLRDWVHRKWNDLDNGLKDLATGDTIEERKDEVAWIIVFAIAENGTDGVFFANRSFEAAKQAGEQFLAQFENSDDLDAARKIIENTVDFALQTGTDIIADEASDRGNLLQSGYVVVRQAGETVFEAEAGG